MSFGNHSIMIEQKSTPDIIESVFFYKIQMDCWASFLITKSITFYLNCSHMYYLNKGLTFVKMLSLLPLPLLPSFPSEKKKYKKKIRDFFQLENQKVNVNFERLIQKNYTDIPGHALQRQPNSLVCMNEVFLMFW